VGVLDTPVELSGGDTSVTVLVGVEVPVVNAQGAPVAVTLVLLTASTFQK